MYAALKDTAVDVALYVGTDEEAMASYPEWVTDDVLGYWDVSYGADTYGYHFDSDSSLGHRPVTKVIFPYQTMMVMNRYQNIDFISVDAYSDLYYDIDLGRAALKENCVDYFIYDVREPLFARSGRTENPFWNAPDWLRVYINSGDLYLLEWHNNPLPSVGVFVKNRLDEVRLYGLGEFSHFYEH